MSSNKILVTGSKGQLGSEIRDLAFLFPQFSFVFFDKEDFSLDDIDKAGHIFHQHQPAYCINCAAYTAVDRAEYEKEQANAINGYAVGNLASLCRQYHTRFIHISTDYVFNGRQTKPWKETDDADPVNIYGASKLLGEELALKNNPETIIIRTSWVYSPYGQNFVKTMIRLMNEKESIGIINDQTGSPTYAADLAEAIMKIISSGKWEPGIYHYSNEGIITWFDFAGEIKKLIHSNCVINPLSTDQYPTPAKRPRYSVLDKTKIRHTFSVTVKDWKESLKVCIDKVKAAT